jgi:hypothetical protein
VLGQFLVHFLGLMLVVKLAYPYVVRPEGWSPDSDFKPDVLNTSIFFYHTWVDAVNFLVNYQGVPFMEPLSQNGSLRKTIQVFMVGFFAALLNIEPLPDLLELAPFPDGYTNYMILLLLSDLGLCYTIEKTAQHIRYGRHK